MRVTAFVLGLVACVIGGGGFGWGWFKGNADLQSSGATIGVAGLALVGVAAGISTWRTERRKAREEEQRRIYGALIQELFARFTQSADLLREAALRAQVVTWANPQVVTALASWHKVYDTHVAPLGGGVVSLDAQQKRIVTTELASLVSIVRQDLDIGAVDIEDIRRSLFNDGP